ncbi:MAG: hypothetical protein H7Z21_11290 [Hymenobacter sp.]|nr:hypothetical protein [Hymenobacter sp.]
MRLLKPTTFVLLLFASAIAFTACEDDTDEPGPAEFGRIDIEFENVVGSNPLQLNSATPYTTPAGDQFTVTTFRYYISNIKLKKADGTEFIQPEAESYYLIDQARTESQKISIPNVPDGDYNSLTFTIGVDSARNVDGVKPGALAPSDMFWNWNTGYIFMKLEGRSPQAPNSTGAAAGGPLVYHIGGFRRGQNAVRTVTPGLNGRMLQVRESRTPEVHIKADVLKMFSGSTTIRMAQLNTIHMPGPGAVTMSANYAAGMFTVDHVHGGN